MEVTPYSIPGMKRAPEFLLETKPTSQGKDGPRNVTSTQNLLLPSMDGHELPELAGASCLRDVLLQETQLYLKSRGATPATAHPS